ncbi:MAG: sulfotransferase [Bacteroidota bacterium]
MPKTILHIGYPKTATTWFINNFYPNVKNASCIYYNDISFDISEGNEKFIIKDSKLSTEKELLIIPTHIFSGLVSGSWKNGAYRSFFITRLKTIFPDACIVIFIRNQVDFIISAYSSYLKRGGTYSLNKLLMEEMSTGKNLFTYDYLDYPLLIRQYSEAFGIENLKIFVYEDLVKNRDPFLKDYIEKLGLDIDLSKLVYSRSNEKLRTGLMKFIRHSNKFFHDGMKPKRSYINLPFVSSFIGRRIDGWNNSALWGARINRNNILSKEMCDFLNDRFKTSNRKLISEFGISSIADYGYPL